MAFFGEVSAFSLSHIPDLKAQPKGCVIDFSWENMSKSPLTLNREPTPTTDQRWTPLKSNFVNPRISLGLLRGTWVRGRNDSAV